MTAEDDWAQTMEERKHRREQGTIRWLGFIAGIVFIATSGMIAYCGTRPSSPRTDPSTVHGEPCNVSSLLQPGETISCPDYAKPGVTATVFP